MKKNSASIGYYILGRKVKKVSWKMIARRCSARIGTGSSCDRSRIKK